MSGTRIAPVLDSQSLGEIESRKREGGAMGRAVVIGLCLVLMFGPLAFGAVEEWAVLGLQLASASLFLLWLTKQIIEGKMQIRTPLAIPICVFGAVVLSQIVLHTSAYRYATVQAGLRYLAFAMLCVVATNALRDNVDDRNFWMILACFGSLLSLFAIAQRLTSPGKIYWTFEVHGGSLFGPYVNRNHYAGLMEMLAPLPLVMCMRRDLEAGQRVVLAFAGALMCLSILMSQSRGGILALCVQIGFIAAASLRARNRRAATTTLITALAVVCLLVWLGMAGDVARRMGTLGQPLQDSAGANRLAIAKDSLPMIAQRPLTGWGLGTFPTVYPRFRTFYTDLFVNQAHNDYLQMVVETGMVGLGAMLALLFITCRIGLRRCRHWQIRQSHALTLAALVGISGIVVHSLFDFNLQIPANAAFFFVLCGIAVRPSRHEDKLFERAD